MENRIVCWFSCGVASAVATKLAIIDNAGKLPLVVARCIVREEHPDNDRFANDCEMWFGVPIINLINEKYDGSIYEVFKQKRYISGVLGAPCTQALKKELRLKFETPNDKHVFGYCYEEMDRYDRFLDANNIKTLTPLMDRFLSHQDCLGIIKEAGIDIPEMYRLGYKHNNCIGCCKATGQGYWNKIRGDFPEMFDKMVKESRRLKVKIIQIHGERRYLDELVEGAGNYREEKEIQCGIFCEMVTNELHKRGK